MRHCSRGLLQRLTLVTTRPGHAQLYEHHKRPANTSLHRQAKLLNNVALVSLSVGLCLSSTNVFITDYTELPITDTAQVVPDTTYQTGPDIPAERTDSPEVAIPEALNAARAGLRTGVSLDDFDSDDFINALRRDTLFEDLDADDFNRGGGDWLRALDSDAEGDEELILQDGNDDESVDDIASVASDESGDDLANEDDGVPVDFDLTNEDLDNLRAGGWDVYMEQQSCQVLTLLSTMVRLVQLALP
ncbi:hypothetical protein DVH05_024605 [Phytophthora capsici]|nr:hypothetical protein DVH05_011169 [Phytophthora capsici]KAG1707953.1 hypothetical protein DVH05_024605 [Phytophthora capsici]